MAAARAGEGTGVRRSATTGVETMYAARAVHAGPVAFVARRAAAHRRRRAHLAAASSLARGAGGGLAAALLLTWVARCCINRRVSAIAETAHRYRESDFSRPAAITGAMKSAWSRTCSTTRRGNSVFVSPTWRASARTWTRS